MIEALSFEVTAQCDTKTGLEVGERAVLFIGPYRVSLGERECRAFEVAFKMAADELRSREVK